jgi:preprotein translocase subunit YajC
MSTLSSIQQPGAPAPAPQAPAAPAAPAAAPASAPAAAPGTTQAPAPGGADPAAPSGPPALSMLPMLLMFVVIFYLLILRPQRKQQKEREAMIAAIKKNDHVLTHAGIYGIVKQVQDADLVLCIDENKDVRIRVSRTAIAGLVKPAGGDGAAADAKPEASDKK